MNSASNYIPSSENEALKWLLPMLDQPMEQMPAKIFNRGWAAVFYLYGGLHPDGALDHGTEISMEDDGPERFRDIEPRLIAPFYTESGWPVLLAPLAAEAARRYESGLLHAEDFYPSDAQHAGLVDRMNG